MKILKLAGADVSAITADGDTPLDHLVAHLQGSDGWIQGPEFSSQYEAVLLLQSPDQRAALLDGSIPPQMAQCLKKAAEALARTPEQVMEYIPHLVRAQLLFDEASDDFSDDMGSFCQGAGAVLRVCKDVLDCGKATTVANVQEQVGRHNDAALINGMLGSGGKIEFCLDALFRSAEDAFRGECLGRQDEGNSVAQDLGTIPTHPMDGLFELAFHAACGRGGESMFRRGPYHEDVETTPRRNL
jgi:hypothetical protein